MINNLLISIIIPTYNDWNRLKLCICALNEQNYPFYKYEVIIVNNSLDNNCPFNIQLSNIKLIQEAKPGSYAARNTGATIAKGRYLAFTDSDCIPDKDWLRLAEETFKVQKCDLIGGKIELFQEKEGSRLIYIYEKNKAFKQHINVPKGNGATANLFVRKSTFERVGGFKSDIKSGGDWEFTRRCIKHNSVMLYADNVKVLHPARRSLYSLLKKHYRLVCWGTINAQNEFGYSKLRILFGNLFHEIVDLLSISKYSRRFFDALIIYAISLIIFVFKFIISLLIIMKLVNPHNVRE